jgi:serine phosphatase RsbU (regulator of sigma subunit)
MVETKDRVNTTQGQLASIDAASGRALGHALQRSEGRRVALVLIVLIVATGVVWLRHLLQDGAMPKSPSMAALALLVAIGGYATVSALLIWRAVNRGILLPTWFWAAGAVLESLIPTAAILILQELTAIPRTESIAAPAILLYGVFIVASILRLRPWLSLLSGGVCAVGHLALILRLIAVSGGTLPPGSLPYLFSYPVFLLLTGVMAALVSQEVRRYLDAALREAETRRKLGLIQNEMEIARSIQQGLMPKASPDVPGFGIAGWNRPASRTGGDYYDWQLLPDGRLAVVIADVTGHGLGPALLMAVCRAYARACVPAGPELRSALRRVNELLCGDVTDGRFVTLAAAVVESSSGQVQLLSAGHGPILLFHAKTTEVEEFGGDGLPLGLLEDEPYGGPTCIQLASGDLLLLVTDGFVEWARSGDGEQYGVQRLSDFLRRNAALDPATFIQLLARDVEVFGAGSLQADDMTAVVIRRR